MILKKLLVLAALCFAGGSLALTGCSDDEGDGDGDHDHGGAGGEHSHDDE